MDDRIHNRRTRRRTTPRPAPRTTRSFEEQEDREIVEEWLEHPALRVVCRRIEARIDRELEQLVNDREMTAEELHVAQERIHLLRRLVNEPLNFLLGN